ncbi:MAG TPA: FAD-binding oxidoreductase [Candidatus Polarisedimenticolia bacterium]|nr:FAD-binding oxidoreductase [Candidatus Polarisedimenticolia bacterium]
MTQTAALARHHLDRFRDAFGGEVIGPADDGYDDARRVWNAVFDRRPAAIARPDSVGSVASAIRFGRERDLEIAVRGGGHSASGHSTCDGGLVIDLSAMPGVTVDPERRSARANGGALLGELDIAAQAHGLVCPVGVIGHTGVAGLTLGGGVGRLQRNFGLTIDSLRAVELVTADGRTVRASAIEEPELFWGIRGAGWNFGLATAFEFGLHEFGPLLHRSARIYPASQAHDVWATFRDFADSAPDAVSMIYTIGRAVPEGDYPDSVAGQPIVIVSYNHSGRAEDVDRDVAPLTAGPAPVSVTSGSAKYLEVQTSNDLAMAWGGRSFILSGYANDLSAAVLDALIEHVRGGPDEGSVSVTAQGGAIRRVPAESTAFVGRQARFDVSADVGWPDATGDEAGPAWVRRAMAIVSPDALPGGYSNGNSDAGPAQTRALYGDETVGRLAALKRVWDPDNVFHLNHNVAP